MILFISFNLKKIYYYITMVDYISKNIPLKDEKKYYKKYKNGKMVTVSKKE